MALAHLLSPADNQEWFNLNQCEQKIKDKKLPLKNKNSLKFNTK